jgi:hypothetical protein
VITGVLGAALGLGVALFVNPLPLRPRTLVVPAAYIIPKIPRGTALRMAMVHDVLHERYLRHGRAWYLKRNEVAQKILDSETTRPSVLPSEKYLNAMDDLAIGLERTGRLDRAEAVLRQKLAIVSPLPSLPASPSVFAEHKPAWNDVDTNDLKRILAAEHLSVLQRQQYSTCANLGTIIAHANMRKAMARDPRAKAQVREGLDFIERSIAINPGAHFGREVWQAIAIEHLLAAIDHPNLLTDFDLIGQGVNDIKLGRISIFLSYRAMYYRMLSGSFDRDPSPEERITLRSNILRVGISDAWAEIVQPDYRTPMPFDEPTLAIIGMWTMGGGPSPHFAMALGRTMEDVGERAIAWNAYECAIEMKEQFSPDPEVCEQLAALCRDAQDEIAKSESPGNLEAWQSDMRQTHVKELAWGREYQRAYQDFEAGQIAAGIPLDDPKFYDPFFEDRAPIASSVGLADEVIVTRVRAGSVGDFLPCMLLGAGVFLAIGLAGASRALAKQSA